MHLPSLESKRITIMGLGRFGGGAGVTRWLADQGADVLLTDLEPESKLTDSVASLRDLIDSGRVTLRLGGHNVSDFTDTDLIVANPAVPHPWDNRFLRAALAARIPVTTEIGLLAERLPRRDRIIGITGSAGKSTTSALIHHILADVGAPVFLGGNIGGSLLAQLSHITPDTWIVLELSSFMLHWLSGWSPGIACITNFSANHLDWHGSEEHYLLSKRHILNAQQANDNAILGPGVEEWATVPGSKRVTSATFPPVTGLLIPGAHNRRNAAMAIAAAGIAGIPHDRALTAARTFRGLEHRLQLIAEHDGIRYYDDSKSTTPESTLLAIEALDEELGRRHIHLVAGGYDKGSNLAPIGALGPTLAGLYTIGVTGSAIAAAARSTAVECGTLIIAMERIAAQAKPGDAVLLSTACASWDQFENYEHRARAFAELVATHTRAGALR